MRFRYRCYGLNIESDRAIMLLAPWAFDKADLTVSWRNAPVESAFADLAWQRCRGADLDQRRVVAVFSAGEGPTASLRIRYATEPDTLDLIVQDGGARVAIAHGDAMSADDCESYFVGPMLGAILRLRGQLVLHAAVVEIGGRAVAFVGRKYSGKSTHAAVFVQRGFRALADDMAVLTAEPDGFHVAPGYAMLRLRSGTRERVMPDGSAALRKVYTHGDSHYAALGGGFADTSLPLGAIYVLDRDGTGDALMTPVEAYKALPLLGQNTFANYVVHSARRAAEFALLSRLAAQVPVRSLYVRHGLDNLDAQRDAVLRDLAAVKD